MTRARLRLDRDARRKLGIGPDMIGVVLDGVFKHAACFESEQALVTAIEDEDKNVIVLGDDDWKHSVGLCTVCGGIGAEEPIS